MFATIFSCIIIAAVGIYLVKDLIKIFKFSKDIETINSKNSISEIEFFFSKEPFKNLYETYKKTLKIKIDNSLKTNNYVQDFLNEESICNSSGINLKLVDSGSGILVGLGILGTFLGLTLGLILLPNINTNPEKLTDAVLGLINSAGTAFVTSLLGMFLSLVYIFFEKKVRNLFANSLESITGELDRNNYVDDATLVSHKVKLEFSEIFKVETEKDKYVWIGNLVNEIKKEQEQQGITLKNFLTDGTGNTFKNIEDILDEMVEKITAPSNEMIKKVVEELKISLNELIDSFSSKLYKSAQNDMDKMTMRLSESSEILNKFPKIIDEISNTAIKQNNAINESTEKVVVQLNSLIESFKESVEKQRNVNEEILKNNQIFDEIQKGISNNMELIESNIQEMNSYAELQKDYSEKIKQACDETIRSAEIVGENVNDASKMSKQYANEFKTIKESLSSIFEQMQTGIADYINTIQESTNDYLKEIIDNVNDVTSKLAQPLGPLDDINNQLSESVDSLRTIVRELKK